MKIKLFQLRWCTSIFIAGLVVSGITAIPLRIEVDQLVTWTGAQGDADSSAPVPGWAAWLVKIQGALQNVSKEYPFLPYGTDWLAFGHFVIAIGFVGALRDPVRNRWLFDWGLTACVLVIPYALIFGALRGIPFWWRWIDGSFGVIGFVPLWFCRKWARELESGATLQAPQATRHTTAQ